MDQKKKEMMEKVASSMAEGAKKVDSLVNKREILGNLSAPVMLGLVLILIVAIAKSPALLVLGLLGVAIGMAPTVLKKINVALDKVKKENKKPVQESKAAEVEDKKQ